MKETNLNNPGDSTEININFATLLSFLRNYYRRIILVGFLSGIMGVALSFLVSRTYSCQTVLLPEYVSNSKKGLLGMALDLKGGDGAENLIPDLYPNILESVPFGIFLVEQPVVDQHNISYPNLKTYLRKDSTQSFLQKLFGSPAKNESPKYNLPPNGIIYISSTNFKVIKSALGCIRSYIDSRSGIITIVAETDDPLISAAVVNFSKNYLINYVEEYRTEKAKNHERNLASTVEEAKMRLKRAQYALNSYRDRNRNPFLEVSKIEQQELQAEYTLAESLYADIIREFEQAKVKTKEEKPVFKVLEPPRINTKKSGPRRLVYGLVFSILGAGMYLVGILFLAIKRYYN